MIPYLYQTINDFLMSKTDFFCIRNTTYLPVHDTCLKSLSKNVVVSRRQFVVGVASDLQKQTL